MKKRTSISLLLIIILLFGTFVFNQNSKQVNEAAIIKTDLYNDNFDNTELSDIWTATGGIEQETIYSTLRLNKLNIWQPAISLQKFEFGIYDNFTIQFDISVLGGSGWLGIVFGLPSISSSFYDAETLLMMSGENVGYWQNTGSAIEESQDTSLKLNSSPVSLAGTNKTTLKFDIIKVGNDINGNYYSVDFSYGISGSTLTKYINYPHMYIERYFGFCSMPNLTIDIQNFSITDDEHIITDIEKAEEQALFYDDFSSGSITYPTEGDITKNWRVTHTYSRDKVFCGQLKNVSFTGVSNGMLRNESEINSDSRVEKTFEFEFDANFKTLDSLQAEKSSFGVGFGLNEGDVNPSSINFIGIRNVKPASSIKGIRFVVIKNGIVTEIADMKAMDVLLNVGESDGCRFVFSGYYDGSIEVSVGSAKYRFNNIAYNGMAAIGVVSDTGGMGYDVKIDNFLLATYIYQTSNSEDVAIDFKSVKEFEEDGETYQEHFINTDIWYTSGAGVSIPGLVTRHYLQMVNATGTVAFGPKQPYSEFIIRFDVTATNKKENLITKGEGIGITFGRPFLNYDASKSPGVLFSYSQGATVIQGVNALTAGGSNTVSNDIDLWENTTNVYNLMFVVSGRTINVYMKKSTDDESEMGILRAQFVDVNTYGYVAVTCDTTDGKKGNFRITNLSITNLSLV